MAIIVPFTKPSASQIAGSGAVPPPNDPFLLMSAAQMHSERQQKKDKPDGKTALGS